MLIRSVRLSQFAFKQFCLFALIILFPTAQVAGSDSNLEFGSGIKYDTGIAPSVSLNDAGVAVEIHEAELTSKLWYRVGGEASIYDVVWGNAHDYDTGYNPSVTVTGNGTVIEVHDNGRPSKDLWYHIGTVNQPDKTITWWGGAKEFDDGLDPAVAARNDGIVVEVHETSSVFNWKLWYRVGTISESQGRINWGDSDDYDSGVNPAVAIADNGVVVEIHESEGHDDLYYHVGIVNAENRAISWGPSIWFDTGEHASVALGNDGTVIEVHQSEDAILPVPRLWYRIGTVDSANRRIDWRTPGAIRYDNGQYPAVAWNGELSIQVHQDQGLAFPFALMEGAEPRVAPIAPDEDAFTQEPDAFNPWELWYSTSLMVDRSRWMETMLPRIGQKRLWEITLPATHDSGAYDLRHEYAHEDGACGELYPPWYSTWGIREAWAEAQEASLLGQLKGGVRYFDLRPVKKNGEYFAFHLLKGPRIEDILNDIRAFMQTVDHELVIINVSHCCNFSSADHAALISMIKDESVLGDYLYRGEPTADLLGVPLEDFVADGPRVLVLYKDPFIDTSEGRESSLCGDNRCIWRVTQIEGAEACTIPPEAGVGGMAIFDEFAGTIQPPTMELDQWGKWWDCGGDASHLFLMSWTLTTPDNADDYEILYSNGITSLHALSEYVNPYLGPSMRLNYNAQLGMINLLYVDFFAEARATDMAIAMNGGLGNTPPVALCRDVTVAADEDCLVAVSIDDGSFDPDGDQVVLSQNPPGPYPLGETAVELMVTDAFGASETCTASVVVVDDTPPEISVALNRDVLWPPNHKMSDFSATIVVTDNCDLEPTFVLTTIESNEPDNGLGDGDTPHDIQVAEYGTSDLEFQLRSERAGTGNGRMYTVVYTAMDASGNEATASAVVMVPHNQSGVAMLSSAFGAFSSDGKIINPDASKYSLIVPSGPKLDTDRVDPEQVYVGNHLGVVRPLGSDLFDATGDNIIDLVLYFDVAQTHELRKASRTQPARKGAQVAEEKDVEDEEMRVVEEQRQNVYPLGLHYRTDDFYYLVENIFCLGEPFDPMEKKPLEEDGAGDAMSDAMGLQFNLTLTRAGNVKVDVYSVSGRRVVTLVNEHKAIGTHRIGWDGRDQGGKNVANGVYFYQVLTPQGREVRKLVLVR